MNSYFTKSQLSSQRTPHKVCMACGETILWRRRLATTWDEVMYCSAACRRVATAKARTGRNDHAGVYGHVTDESVASAA